MTLTAAAVCPHPPLLIPAATGGAVGPGDAELVRLRQACAAAAGALAVSDLIVIVGGDRHTTRYPPRVAGTLAGLGVPFSIGSGEPVLPLSLTIGRWLMLDEHHVDLQGVASDLSPAACRNLGKEIAGRAPAVAILAMGDGPARRARQAPGAPDAAADRYDEQVAAALASASASDLADLDPAQDGDLFVAGRAAWQVLAGAAEASGTAFTGSLRYAGAPFEVSYFVASWTVKSASSVPRLHRISTRRDLRPAGRQHPGMRSVRARYLQHDLNSGRQVPRRDVSPTPGPRYPMLSVPSVTAAYGWGDGRRSVSRLKPSARVQKSTKASRSSGDKLDLQPRRLSRVVDFSGGLSDTAPDVRGSQRGRTQPRRNRGSAAMPRSRPGWPSGPR